MNTNEHKTMWSGRLVPLVYVAFCVVMAIASRGFLEPDEIMHFLLARAMGHDWRNVVSIWGRFGVTGLFGLAAPGGIVAARLVAVGVTALTACGTAVALRHVLAWRDTFHERSERSFFSRHAMAFAWLLLFAQPCVVLNSFTVMTEMLLACCWIWAVVALLKWERRPMRGVLWAAVLVGLGGWMRPEGWIAIAVWPAWVFAYLRWRGERGDMACARGRAFVLTAGATVIALLPVAFWYVLGVVAWRDPRWVIMYWPWSATSQYGRTGGLFLISCVAALAAWMWVPVVSGAATLVKGWRGGGRRGLFLLVLPAGGFFLLHGVLGAFGLFGSLSLPRYFVCVAPLLAILAIVGLIRLDSKHRRSLRVLVIMLALAPTVSLIVLGYLPMRATREQRQLDVAVQAVRTRSGAESESMIVGHPYALLALGFDPDSPAHVRVFSRDAIAHAPAGTLLIADSSVWAYESRPTAAELTAWGYRLDEGVAAAVDAVPERLELLTIPRDAAARVRLWRKD